jgi:hypothetical protein
MFGMKRHASAIPLLVMTLGHSIPWQRSSSILSKRAMYNDYNNWSMYAPSCVRGTIRGAAGAENLVGPGKRLAGRSASDGV